MPSLQALAKGTLATAVGLSTLTAGVLYYGQGYLIYPSAFPPGSRIEVETPDKYGLAYEDVTLDTVDGIKIKCYLMLQGKQSLDHSLVASSQLDEADEKISAHRPTIIMFHGNGGNMGHRIPLAGLFHRHMRCNVLMLSYRGYGRSQGTPSENAGIRIDAQTALDYVISHPALGPSDRNPSGSKIILYGQSLGGAVALDLAVRNPHCISGLILENTFLSIPRLIPTAVPFLSPFTFLCHQTWDNATAMTKLPADMALLMLSGRLDEIVPAQHMSELWKLAQKSERKNATWRHFPGGMHNNTCMQQGYWDVVTEFVGRVDP
ncbi:Alpha/Beta hydrolase protein [Gautieria morchelliformis]|nr:Alpha/Beta hydrolase protein [Gautieria morchelliformis]